MLRPLLRRALTGEHAPLPGDLQPPGCTLTVGATGRCIAVTVWGPTLSRDAVADAPSGPVPIAEVGIAVHSRCGARLWRSLHDLAERTGAPVATDRHRCPPEPWVAALLYPSGMIYRDAVHWLGDLECRLAWAWLEEISA